MILTQSITVNKVNIFNFQTTVYRTKKLNAQKVRSKELQHKRKIEKRTKKHKGYQ